MSEADDTTREEERTGTDESTQADGSGVDVSRAGGEVRSPAAREFGWRGWLLLAMLFVAFFVAPALIYVRPPAVSFTFAYLVLPLVPATVLAFLAVWAATR
jgi:hypothetical protein